MNTKNKFFSITAIMLLGVVLMVGCGTAPTQYQYSWEIYEVDKSAYLNERLKMVDSLENTLLKHKFYPDEKNNLEKPGEGNLMTNWNEEFAKKTLSSYEGYRLRVHALITDDLTQFDEENDDPVLKRYLETTEEKDNKKIRIGLALAVEKQINAAMPRYIGDLESARWEYEGEDLDYAKRLHYEILKSFNLVAKDPINVNDYLSDKMKKILEGDTNTSEKKDKQKNKKPKDDFRILD